MEKEKGGGRDFAVFSKFQRARANNIKIGPVYLSKNGKVEYDSKTDR